jgi:maltooligosyltrehalose trehalohydrolase
MRFGAELLREGVRFRLFAPIVRVVRLVLEEGRESEAAPIAMNAVGDGWHELFVAGVGAGTRYRFVLEDGRRVPDPASRFQPVGVHGPSEVIDPRAFEWSDDAWRGRRWGEAVLYELHVGAFTPEGTFRAAMGRLDSLAGLGITGIELMCVNAFAGQRSWGYDGVLLYATDSTYGRPEELKAFVNEAHRRGLMVILDVVYNHFGPEGNYLPRYFPQIFSVRHKTAWGPGLNFDGPRSHEVRELILSNAAYWIEEFHVDGLRLDASHAMTDRSEPTILEELAERARRSAGGREIHLILESERSEERLLARDANGEASRYTAQWNHAIDHLLGLAMRAECPAGDEAALHEVEEFAKAATKGFASAEEDASSGEAPGEAFVSFIQTHDLIGNRVAGRRIHSLASREAVRAIAAIYLLLPQTPMLFMGEEWATRTPFPYFSDYGGELGEKVRQGRREQLATTTHASEEELAKAPDPQAEATFRSAKLDWKERAEAVHAEQADWYRRVLAARRERMVPLLKGLAPKRGGYRVLGAGRLEAEWELADGRRLMLAANLCGQPGEGFATGGGELLWLEGSQAGEGGLGPWTVRWTIEA